MPLFFVESLATFADDLRRTRPTLFVSVPRLWLKFHEMILQKMPDARLQRLLGLPLIGYLVRRKIIRQLGLDAARFAASGAAPLGAEAKRWFARLGLEIHEGYGMTELGCTSHGTMGSEFVFDSVGYPGDGIEQRIDPDTGEVQVLTPGATLGYYKSPAQTAELFTADGWVRTGDLGRIDAAGRLHIVGRLKDIFKTSKGKYVAPAPIEQRLLEHEWLESAIVIGTGLAQPVAVVVLSEAARALTASATPRGDIEATLAAHLSALNAGLDPHERLDRLLISLEPWLPDNGLLTPTMKMRRPALEQKFARAIENAGHGAGLVAWL